MNERDTKRTKRDNGTSRARVRGFVPMSRDMSRGTGTQKRDNGTLQDIPWNIYQRRFASRYHEAVARVLPPSGQDSRYALGLRGYPVPL